MAIAVHPKEGSKPKAKQKQQRSKKIRKKGWSTPYGFLDFNEPVTYMEALSAGKELADHFK